MDYVFHLAGIKGSPAMTAEQPASFFVPTLQFSINMMEAARRQGIVKYLFTSSVGVYEPAEIFYEDDVHRARRGTLKYYKGRIGPVQSAGAKHECVRRTVRPDGSPVV